MFTFTLKVSVFEAGALGSERGIPNFLKTEDPMEQISVCSFCDRGELSTEIEILFHEVLCFYKTRQTMFNRPRKSMKTHLQLLEVRTKYFWGENENINFARWRLLFPANSANGARVWIRRPQKPPKHISGIFEKCDCSQTSMMTCFKHVLVDKIQ